MSNCVSANGATKPHVGYLLLIKSHLRLTGEVIIFIIHTFCWCLLYSVSIILCFYFRCNLNGDWKHLSYDYYLRKTFNECVNVSLSGSFDNFVHRNCSEVISINNIFSNACIKQHRFLRDNSNLRSHPLQMKTRNGMSIYQLTNNHSFILCNVM